METRPKGPRRWPNHAEHIRLTTIDHARSARELLAEARAKLTKRDHPALIAIDIADAMTYLADIERILIEAKVGTD